MFLGPKVAKIRHKLSTIRKLFPRARLIEVMNIDVQNYL